MSQEIDRISVPTNGKGPRAAEEPAPVPEAPSPVQATVLFTPTQFAVGFGILASLAVIVASRLFRRGRSGRRS